MSLSATTLPVVQKHYLEAKLVANEECDACEAAFGPNVIRLYRTDEKGLCEHGKRVERKTPDGRKIYTYRCTGDAQDRDKEVISPDGWDFSAYEKNPVILDSHDYGGGISAIIGRALPPLRRDGNVWDVDVVYASSPLSRGPLAKDLVDEGMLNAVSVGFISIESERKPNEPRKHLKQELLEISNVAIPSYRDALRVASFAGNGYVEFGVEYLKYLKDGGAALSTEEIVALTGTMPLVGVSEKAADFNTVLMSADSEQECRERRWDLNSALSQCIRSAAEEEGLTSEQRVALVDTSLGQYHAAMLEWFKTMIALPAETVSEVVEYLSADDEAETKAGAKLSAKSKGEMQAACDELQSARDRLMKMMAEPEEMSEDDMPKSGNPPEQKAVEPQVSEPVAETGSELNVDVSALNALVEMEV